MSTLKIKARPQLSTFAEVPLCSVFVQDCHYYFKCLDETGEKGIAVNLCTGHSYAFSDSAKVEFVRNAELVIEV